MSESRARGEVLFFDGNNALWCTGISESDQLLTGFVENGYWYLKYDKVNHISYACEDKNFSYVVTTTTDSTLTNRVKVHWKRTKRPRGYFGEMREYNLVIDRAREELINPTENEFPEPEVLTHDEMLEAFRKKLIVVCNYDYAQYQCDMVVDGIAKVLYTRDKEEFDDEIPF